MEKEMNKPNEEIPVESTDQLTLVEKIKKLDWMMIIRYLGLVLVLIVFGFTSDGRLFGAYNISIVIQQTVSLAIVCLGGVFVY